MKHFCSVFVEKKKKEFRVQLFFGGLPYFEFFAGIFFFRIYTLLFCISNTFTSNASQKNQSKIKESSDD